MAADSDGCDLTTVVTCEGDLSDPGFADNFETVVNKLNAILGDVVKVHKLEPWNSVRVTLSIPREAALRLRKLASEGSAQLRALGILSVQVEGDQVISLRIANSLNNAAEPQEIRLQTTQDGSGSSQLDGPLRFLGATAAAATSAPSEPPEKVQFKSPNVVCPPDSVVPKVPVSGSSVNSSNSPASKGGPFPFTSMNQAIHSHVPPPPYPGKHPATVTISSPLLVNLLQNDGAGSKSVSDTPLSNSAVKANRTVQKQLNLPRTISRTVQKNTKLPQACTSSSPSALSNTSIRQNSIPNSTMSVTLPAYVNNTVGPTTTHLPPPPPYSVAVNNRSQMDSSSSSVVQTSSPFMDLIPSLTDLKADDLEHLLPTLERDLARSPPEIPEELTHSDDKRNFLINPLTGELEPQSSAGESDNDDLGDVFTGLPSPAALSDDDTNSTIRPETTDQSDSETRSSHSDSGKHTRVKSKVQRDRGRDSPNLKPTEKIKLRLKLEKSEPVNSAYKVDVSFIQQQPKKGVTSSPATPPGEELRVPPLHISLRGRHHAFITNKKKKLNPDKLKMRKMQDLGKTKKSDTNSAITLNEEEESSERKVKKFKSNYEHDSDSISKLVIHHNSTHYKEKQKERRGSDSELSRANLKFVDSNGIISVEKKRRLSQSEPGLGVTMGMSTVVEPPPILGSTNVGTITGLPQKPRKDKSKVKDVFKNKDLMRSSKSFTKSLGEKFNKQQIVALPTGEIDMEAKFKQRLMEGMEKGIPRPPHRTSTITTTTPTTVGACQLGTENNQVEKSDQVIIKAESELPLSKEKSPEPDKCNTPDRSSKQNDLGDKQSGRSPNSGGQGEDSGIESMDALSEKSPNQASQSPHADIPEPTPSITTTTNNNNSSSKSKTQVPEMPDMLDIEAQLAKMEGLNGVEDDMIENNHNGDSSAATTVMTTTQAKKQLGQCCELTSALQDSLKQGAVSLTAVGSSKEPLQPADVSMVPVKSKTKEDDLEPLPVRVTPPLYTYSNPEKSTRAGSESPTTLSDDDDEDSNSCSTNMHSNANINSTAPAVISSTSCNSNKTKSLLEQLLIEIPDSQTPSSPSPATRSSVRTRALSKLSSPELNSPVLAPGAANTTAAATKTTRAVGASNVVTPMTKRKRHESDSSNNSIEDTRNKKTRKCSENAAELIKACMGVDVGKVNHVKKGVVVQASTVTATAGKLQDESSDSDEPLIEKVRKTTAAASVGKKIKSGGGLKAAVSTRRSVRTAPTPNTRSRGEKVMDSEALRRKTRSAVSEGDSKRKKEVK